MDFVEIEKRVTSVLTPYIKSKMENFTDFKDGAAFKKEMELFNILKRIFEGDIDALKNLSNFEKKPEVW